MTDDSVIRKIAELTEEINKLPKGYISRKTVNGKVYFYHQWSESGKKKSRYLRNDEVARFVELIEKRNRLQEELFTVKGGKSGKDASGRGTLPCVLMHKRVRVAKLELDRENGLIQKIGKVYAPEHLPVGVGIKKGVPDRAALNMWWTDRSIPASRSGLREALETLKINDTVLLLVRCYGLSLSDQYWVMPEGSDLTWERMNFFQNEFSEDIGDVFFGSGKNIDAINFSSPDSTSDGNLKKRWKILGGKRILIKGGSNPYRQQPFNEIIATEIMKRLDIPCVPYELMWLDGAPYSICEDFITENTELIPAWRIIQTKKQPNNVSLYQHFTECAEELGIPRVREFLDRMIVLDYIIANEDRHLNNFGAVRNADTLEWIGMAPIYDSGSSLGYDRSAGMMRNESETVCKPFKKHHAEQLKLVSSFDWIDFSKLKDIGSFITDVLSVEKAKDCVEENRIRVIAELAEKRVKDLQKAADNKDRKQTITVDDEVGQDTAAAY